MPSKRLISKLIHQRQISSLNVVKPTFNHQIQSRETFSSDDLMVVPNPQRTKPNFNPDKLLFGHLFTDHMFRCDWDDEQGWTRPLISKLHNLDLHPAAKVLHYAVEAFEGAKAYRGHDNVIRFFRLDENIKRLLNSASRLSLPGFNGSELMKCIHQLVELDQDWIPKKDGSNASLYIRPTIMGVEPSLGVAGSKKALLYVILSPVGPYFKTGFKPVSLYADPNVVRAWPGGAGSTKLGSNYAPTIWAQREAEKLGLQQVLWLFGDDMKITEVGTMNVFIALENKATQKTHLITPPLKDGLILPGITRKSIIELASQWSDVVVEERYMTIAELGHLLEEGKVTEMFGSGTACVVCPIKSIYVRNGKNYNIPFANVITQRILKSITDIQYGVISHPWATELGHY